MQSELQAVLDLQPTWAAAAPNQDMALRGFYIRGDIADFVRGYEAEIAGRLQCSLHDLDIAGKDSTGYYSRVPWVRFANRQLSANPREGWYCVYLFAEDGSEVSLSLNQGTQLWDGLGLRSRPERTIRVRSDWAREQIAEAIAARPRLDASIHLGAAEKSRAYEAGNVVAYRYTSGNVPNDEDLAADLLDLADLLQAIYRSEASLPVPGDPAPEIVEAERAARELAGRGVTRRTGFRTNVKQRRAIELRAMKCATAHFTDLGASVKNVSANHSYDLHVTLGSQEKTVEVKGTAGDGTEILLTRAESEHHLAAHPNNALVVVSAIRLQGSPDAPEASGGKVRVLEPWQIDQARLVPISFRYEVGDEADPDS